MDPRDHQALIDIRDVLDRAMGYPIEGGEAFYEKDYLQDAVVRCLEILGEASKRLSPEWRRLHPQVPWRAMAGMRDILFTPTTRSIWRRSGWPISVFPRSVAPFR
ncbi:MAG: DUF86 domain-containing protein [Prochlorococcaceae cyanobacterium]